MIISLALILLAGSLLNALLTGFTTLNIVYVVLSLLFMLFNFIVSKKPAVIDQTDKKKPYVNIIVYGAFVLVFILASKLFAVQNQYSFSEEINHGTRLIQAGKHLQAEKVFSKLLERDGSDPVVNMNLAVIYLKQHKTNLVETHLNVAAQRMSFDENLWYNYGLMNYQYERYDNARACFERAIQLNPDMVNAHIYAGTMSYWMRDMRRSIYHLDNAAFLKPDSPEIYFHLGRSHIELMQYKDAEDSFNTALGLRPSRELEQSINEQLASVKALKGGAVE